MLSRPGFACQGNEFSLFMLLTSSFILNRSSPLALIRRFNFRSLTNNRTETLNQHALRPYIHSFSNVPEASALLREIRIPDVLPSDLPAGANFSMVAGTTLAYALHHVKLTQGARGFRGDLREPR